MGVETNLDLHEISFHGHCLQYLFDDRVWQIHLLIVVVLSSGCSVNLNLHVNAVSTGVKCIKNLRNMEYLANWGVEKGRGKCHVATTDSVCFDTSSEQLFVIMIWLLLCDWYFPYMVFRGRSIY